MPIITNERYKEFSKSGIIRTISLEEFNKILSEIEHKNKQELRAFTILLYVTGRRPSEIITLTAADIQAEGRYISIRMATKKKGVTSKILLKKNPLTKELLRFVKNKFPDSYLFYMFKGKNKQTIRYTVKRTGEQKIKEYIRENGRIFGLINKVTGVPPYFFRHNRYTLMAEKGASMTDIMLAKGAKSIDSVQHYIHMSSEKQKKIAKFYD